MAIIHRLALIGPDSSFAGDDTRKLLGDLMAFLLYREFDKVSSMLLQLTDEDKSDLEIAGEKLSALCKVCKNDIA
jgi:hypothetical protein